MNLRELMTRVENELQHYPDLAAHRSDLRDVINAAYKLFCSERVWPWMLRRCVLLAFPDFEPTDVELVDDDFGARSLEFSGFEGTMYPEADRGMFRQYLTAMAGAELHLVDPEDRDFGTANLEDAPFTIEMSIPQSPDLVRVQLDPRALFTDLGAQGDADGHLVVRFPRLLLPPDVRSVVALRDAEGRAVRALTPHEARDLVDPNATPGRSGWMLEDLGADLRNPTWIEISFDTSSHNDSSHNPFVHQRETWPMTHEISCSLTVTAFDEDDDPVPPSFATGTRIRVFCTWFWSGRFGPPSNVVEFTTTGGVQDTIEVNVTGYPVLPHDGSFIEYGRRVAVFVAEGEGAFYLRKFVNTNAETTTISTPNSTVDTPGLRFPRWDEIYPLGPYQYMRIHPRPTELQRMQLEYIARPRELIEDTDSPEFRTDHEVLVWMSVASLVSRYGGNPQSAMVMAEIHRRAIIAHEFPNARYDMRRGQVDQRRGLCDFFIPPDINYIP